MKKLSDLKKKKELSESSLLKSVCLKDGADVGPPVAAAASTATYRKQYGHSNEDNDFVSSFQCFYMFRVCMNSFII